MVDKFDPRISMIMHKIIKVFAAVVVVLGLFPLASADDARPTTLIGYTEGRHDLPGGQFENWVTNRACVVRADGTERRVLAESLTQQEHAWTQFAGWSPDGQTAVIGFAYGYSASPDGRLISYHEDYQVFVSRADGSGKWKVETKNPFNFVPTWSPDGEWLLFVSGEHYDCHPHVVRKDGTGLRKLADRGGYRGVVERLELPDFHSESSDLPVWSSDGQAVYYTAQVGECIELMRVTVAGEVAQLTKSAAGVRHYHPSPSPDGHWILFGSDRGGSMQLYVARADGTDDRAVTDVPAGWSAMHGHWQPSPSIHAGGR